MKSNSANLSTSEKLGLIGNMATMLTAGISILEIVESLLEDSKGSQKKILEQLKADLVQGNHISTSFEKFPNAFDRVTINLIRAAEEAGTLDVTLKDLKENIRKDAEFKDKIKAALTYPILIVFVFFGVLIMILIVVVPKISVVFSRMNVTLPLPTVILIYMSNMLLAYTIPIIAGFSTIVFLIMLLYRKNKRKFLYILFMLPVVSRLAKEIDLARYSRSMYLLLNAGIPITSALELASEVVLKEDVAKAIKRIQEMVISGKKISEGLKDAKKIFPSIMIKITEAGEKSGSLDKSMLDVSDYLDYQVSNTLRTVTALIEPIMLIVVGILVGGMMLAVIAPIYGMIGQVAPH